MKNKNQKLSIFWFRRDLRLSDNHALYEALKKQTSVLPIFIFDNEIIDELPTNDPRLTFIYERLHSIDAKLNEHSSCLYCVKGIVNDVWKNLLLEFNIEAVYANEDYEPYAIQRDFEVKELLQSQGIPFFLYKDQVIFEKSEVMKNDGTPYTVFTPYKNKWLTHFADQEIADYKINRWDGFLKMKRDFPSMEELKLIRSSIKVHPYELSGLEEYDQFRNFPALNKTSKLGPHLRFGTVSIRQVVKKMKSNTIFLSELIWREFFMQVLFHFPNVVDNNFKRKYDDIQWRNNPEEFDKWKKGITGYPLVDAGMRELNETGNMHNRVRMVVAGFLCKHLLIDWRWGEAYFAEKLLDYELSSNNGNWQWSAGTGCDAAPYFRVFNPSTQIKRFDAKLEYIKKWIPEFESLNYPTPIVEHKFARERAIRTYKEGLQTNSSNS